MRALRLLAIVALMPSCAIRYVKTASGAVYCSAHLAQRETVATVEASTGDGAALTVSGYTRRPDPETVKAVGAATEAMK